MRHPHIDDQVRLTESLPELSLSKGAVGVIRSEWFAPSTCYEVEFSVPGLSQATRALLQAEQLVLTETEDDTIH